MWHDFFIYIVAPITVGVVLALFSEWLDRKGDD
ncbi:type I toxin-antitoxin system Fst family toxin [Streptococcus orisasini]